jgi:hypothetical protein
MAIRHLTMRIVFVLATRHRRGSSTPIEQYRLLCYVGLRKSKRGFSLNDPVCGTPLWVLAPHPPPNICRPYLTLVDRAVRYVVLGVSHDLQTIDQLNCAKRQLSLPMEFGGLMYCPPSSTLNYASFNATLANMNTDGESESLGSMCGLVRQELLNVAISTLPWAVQLRNLHGTISSMGGFSKLDLVVFTKTFPIMRGPASSK